MNENKALEIIGKARANGALVYAPANLDTPPLYKAEVTEIRATGEEFHAMQGGKYMPNKAVTDRIGEAAGVDFIAERCGTRKEGTSCYVGWAQGRVRLPDGSWRYSTVEEYEYDVEVRCEEEFLKGKKAGDSYRQYTDIEKAQKRIELSKVARARAATGARLRVIRQLTGMPVAFTAAEKSRPLIFSRIVQNTDFILQTAEGRMMAIAAATGIAAQVYGAQAAALPAAPAPIAEEALRSVDEATATFEDVPGDVDFGVPQEPPASESEGRTAALDSLREYLESGILNPQQTGIVQKAVDNPNTPFDGDGGLVYYLNLCKAQEAQRRQKRGAA